MMAMRASPAGRRAQGPFVTPARLLLLVAGLLSIALGAFNLGHELHSGNVDVIYVVVAVLVAVVWLVSLFLAWRGRRLGIFLAGLIAFVEFGVIAAAHFVTGPWVIDTYVKHEGLPVAAVLIALLPASALTAMAAVVSWSHPRGRDHRLETVPLLVVSVVGAILVVLQAMDNVQRADFGAAKPEDGAFAAAVAVILWLAGALWIARVRRTGAILVALGTFIVWYSFVTLHVIAGTFVSAIASQSGVIWAGIALGAAILALASFLAALTFLPSTSCGSSGPPRQLRPPVKPAASANKETAQPPRHSSGWSKSRRRVSKSVRQRPSSSWRRLPAFS